MGWREWAGLISRDAAARFETDYREWETWDDQAKKDGFHMWEYTPPPHGSWIECRRREWTTSRVWQENGGSPWMNVRDLWWRPWTGETIEGDIIDAPPE
jgi:hypothetical protein